MKGSVNMIEMEMGPIRPPSEATSLMLRVTRGCHWNKCYFCDLYKQFRFSRRTYEEIEDDLKKRLPLHMSKNIQLVSYKTEMHLYCRQISFYKFLKEYINTCLILNMLRHMLVPIVLQEKVFRNFKN